MQGNTYLLFDYSPPQSHMNNVGDIMPFSAPKVRVQEPPPPIGATLTYKIPAYYGYHIFYSILTPAMIATLMAGHSVIATIQQNGLQPSSNTPYPRVPFHTYSYTRPGQPNDVLGAELQNPANYLLNTEYLIRLAVTDPTGLLIGQSAVTKIEFT